MEDGWCGGSVEAGGGEGGGAVVRLGCRECGVEVPQGGGDGQWCDAQGCQPCGVDVGAVRGRCRVSWWRCQAASALGARTSAQCCGVRLVMVPSRKPAAQWTTACNGCSTLIESSRAASSSRSPTSQARTSTSAPSAISSSIRSSMPGVSGPRRLVSSRRRTPCWATTWRAITVPSPLVPPVISTVPSDVNTVPEEGRVRGRRVRPLRW